MLITFDIWGACYGDRALNSALSLSISFPLQLSILVTIAFSCEHLPEDPLAELLD